MSTFRAIVLLAQLGVASSPIILANRRIHLGQNFSRALLSAGLSRAQGEEVIGALSVVFDFRKSTPGDQIRLVMRSGQLLLFDYRKNAVDEWQVYRRGGQLQAVKRLIDLEKKVAKVKIKVKTSLYEGVLAAGEDPNIALALGDVFAWDIDFYQDVRQGDAVVAFVEKYTSKGRLVRYGELLAASYLGSSVGTKRVFRFEYQPGEFSYFQRDGSSARKNFLKSPLKYAHVTSKFGSRYHPVLKYVKDHNGVDYGAVVGTPVWAVSDGIVDKLGFFGAAGNMLCIRHNHGLESCYLHLSHFAGALRKGTRVAQKQVVAYTGNTGRTSGPHLHFALKRSGSFINPLNQKFPRADPLRPEQMLGFQNGIAEYLRDFDDRTE